MLNVLCGQVESVRSPPPVAVVVASVVMRIRLVVVAVVVIVVIVFFVVVVVVAAVGVFFLVVLPFPSLLPCDLAQLRFTLWCVKVSPGKMGPPDIYSFHSSANITPKDKTTRPYILTRYTLLASDVLQRRPHPPPKASLA